MLIERVSQQGEESWKIFVRAHCPPVGGFMQSWDWGVFQESRNRKIERYFVIDGDAKVAAFTLVHYSLPFGIKYGYSPRGPIIAASYEGRFSEICRVIRAWAVKEFPRFIFLRIEPPLSFVPQDLLGSDFQIPNYYIQPKYNHVIEIDRSEEEILKSFHSSTRSNISRAEKRGVTVEIKNDITADEYGSFTEMMRDTNSRNGGKNIYPDDEYFKSLFSALSRDDSATDNHNSLSLSVIYGYCDGNPAATYFVLFFGDTATYLYGGSRTKYLNSKVTTYLHWKAMLEAKRRGMRYYDLGGIDQDIWPTLTEFKRQFKGREFSYIGNIDMPIRPLIYKIYNFLRRLKK